ncbi:putative invertase inhibitor [Andrographis paniculata]|uniref:putative invertase inhibitor n=1 Tax=Andrographis paniculata TaxID=175694 RepID=UPI0021E845D3|nr:putative invertase inhibitor [Andrographis paniculata]
MKLFYPFFALFHLLFVLMTIPATESQSLINSTCKNIARNDPNINFNFCKTSLQAAPASRCASLRGLGMISIRLVRYNVTDTRCHIKQLLRNRKWDPYTKQCLSDCFELYSDAIPSVKQAMRYYNDKRFDDVNVQITSIMDASTTCEDGFKERKGVVSPLTKRNKDVFQLSAITLSAMRVIQRGTG